MSKAKTETKRLNSFLNAALVNLLVQRRIQRGNVTERERRLMQRALKRSKAEPKAFRA